MDLSTNNTKQTPEGGCTQSPQQLLKTGVAVCLKPPCFSPYASALAVTTCTNWSAGDWSEEARGIFIWCLVFKIVYALEILPLGSQCPTMLVLVGSVCMYQCPLCAQTCLCQRFPHSLLMEGRKGNVCSLQDYKEKINPWAWGPKHAPKASEELWVEVDPGSFHSPQ